jgi:sugar O-acyltransferase (sialic acid O-acetyltransferase NeuD family)
MAAIVILGGGGQAKVLLELLHVTGERALIGILDDATARLGSLVSGVKVIGTFAALHELRGHAGLAAVVAVGDNAGRRRAAEVAAEAGVRLLTLVHPTAVVDPTAKLGAGTCVLAGAIVGPHVHIGRAGIINTKAALEAGVTLGDFVHAAPGSVIETGATIGDGAMIGTGAIVLKKMRVGHGAIVGAGALVEHDVPAGATVVGRPARTLVWA